MAAMSYLLLLASKTIMGYIFRDLSTITDLYNIAINHKSLQLITNQVSKESNAISFIRRLCYHSIIQIKWPLILIVCTCIVHDVSSQVTEGQGQGQWYGLGLLSEFDLNWEHKWSKVKWN